MGIISVSTVETVNLAVITRLKNRKKAASLAAYFHGLRVHMQIITWKLLDDGDIDLKPEEWGWMLQKGNYILWHLI